MNEPEALSYDVIAASNESTVVSEYIAEPRSETAYQSEAQLEREFIQNLQAQAYEYLTFSSEAELIDNLRTQLEALNNFTFTDGEWKRFFTTYIASANDGIEEKTVRIQETRVETLTLDNGMSKNIKLIDATNIHNNRLQVTNQYEIGKQDGAQYDNRYDVTILVNGFPLVHVELKRRGVPLREAFNQINRYQRHSFWAGSGLFEYAQLFVISNGTETKYYSNTTRDSHVKAQQRTGRRSQASNAFEFTSWWADATNKPITDLTAFTKTFFAKHALLNILTRFCVLTHERNLLVMRPYQIVATERILSQINIATNYKRLGTVDAGGYIWHTTGSGKTLTSFKTAKLATQLPQVDKVLFVVDRRDLDYQTMAEYENFEKGAAMSNSSTAVLAKQLSDPNARIIVTTIQKLSNFVNRHKHHDVYGQHVVLIFDECHRSQFGDMHRDIKKSFKKYNLFGFTGTPIFAVNAGAGKNYKLRTTEQAFGAKLHTYTIVDAIRDQNVLPFRVDYVKTVEIGNVVDQDVSGIAGEKVLLDPRRISGVTSYILQHFAQKTRRSNSYSHRVISNVVDIAKTRKRVETTTVKHRVSGFNALFATASVDAAKRYYNEFKRQQADLPEAARLKIATIYSYGVNDGVAEDGTLEEEAFDALGLTLDDREFLDEAIADYNMMFGTSYDTSSDGFQNYYRDLSMRLKNRELDMAIVVNMFLTGFDAKTMNTLFVDKNLRSHGLIQAYSRTNRILNSVKTYGNIVSFRNLEDETNAALELFGNREAKGIVMLKPYAEYYEEYAKLVHELKDGFMPGEIILGESAEKAFIALFGKILRLENILASFDEFTDAALLSDAARQDYSSTYQDLRATYLARRSGDREDINDDVVFEIELVKQIEVNIDYILMLVDKHRSKHGDDGSREIAAEISRAISASPTLRSKKDLIEEFVERVSPQGEIDGQWQKYVQERCDQELRAIIEDERLVPVQTHALVERGFREGVLPTGGLTISRIMPPTSLFAARNGHGEKKQRVVEKLQAFFERFYGLFQPEQDV